MASPWFFIILVMSALCCSVVGSVDKTLDDGATGSDVVQAVIAKIEASRIPFGSDHRLLRRIAYVESADGTKHHSLCSDTGGVWALQEDKFNTVLSTSELDGVRDIIHLAFGIDWTQTTIADLCKPFYAGLAARMYLYYLEITATAIIPLAGNVVEQAQFWLTYYHSNTGGLTTHYFVEQVTLLEEKESCKVNTDIFFVLDGSGSIGSGNFGKIRQFEQDFVTTLIIGPQDNQVGTIIFSDVAEVIFYLNSFDNTPDLLTNIRSMQYPGGDTNTPDGLCKLVRYGFTEGNGARPSSGAVFRIAIVMTDGRSNEESYECQWNTLQAAEAVHDVFPPILVYVIGVTDSVNQRELEAIATMPDYVTYLDSFDGHILQEAQEKHADEICRKASVPASTDEEMNGTLEQNETVRYHFPIPVVGISVRVCISLGHIVIYGSVSIANPNSAFYDWILELEFEQELHTEHCESIYIDPSKLPPSPPPINQPTNNYPSPTSIAPTTSVQTPQPTVFPGSGFPVPGTVELTDRILYLSLVGTQPENDFIVNGTVGNVYNTDSDGPSQATSTDVGEEVFIIVAASSSGIIFIFLCVMILCCICGYYMCCHKKKTDRVSQYSLLPRNTDTVWLGEE